MESYIDLVLCETPQGIILYQAPKFSMLKENDEVIVKDAKGKDSVVHVKNVMSIAQVSDEYKFILMLNGKEPPKISGKLKFDEFDYSEPKDGDGHG